MAAFWCSFIPILFLFVSMETRPLHHQRDEKQVMNSLFGSHLASLVLAPPISDDITEGSANQLSHSQDGPSELTPRGSIATQETVPRFFVDFLRYQAKMRRWNRKSTVGGRGCFGMKMDRIGSISGLGC